MCGICGFVSKKEITLEQLKNMNDTMINRGPDDGGEEIFTISNGYNVGFAQRRLSILDLSKFGHQPMHSINNRVVVTYNGEIYNFEELKSQLSDYPFMSHCDTEVILAAYLKWGISCVNRFNGMFAIALFDKETNELYLARDRIGKKPLYYWSQEQNIVFASSLKPIMECPNFNKEINEKVIKRYLFQQYINEPYSIFNNVFKVEPGQIVKFKFGQLEKCKYWDISEIYNKKRYEKIDDYYEAKSELKGILREAIKLRLVADVPVGTFLSGGYDSSIVTAIAQEISCEPIKTYSIGFEDTRYDEAKYAKNIASFLGTNHTEQYIDDKLMLKLVESIPQYYDEPFADDSQIPTMLVSYIASKNVTVVLSGDGGDEFFCGYDIYDYLIKAQKLDIFGKVANGVFQLPIFEKKKLLEKFPYKVQAIVANNDEEIKSQLGKIRYSNIINNMLSGDEVQLPIKFRMESKYNEKNWQIRRMLIDEETYLPGDILCKVDRASMKYSIETRCPLLDVNVMEYSYRLPQEYKYSKGVKKRILKDITYDYIPKELLDRPKQGFSVPIDKWLEEPLREQLEDMSSVEYLKKQGIFDALYVNEFVGRCLNNSNLISNYCRVIWSFFIFQKWYGYYME